MSPLHRLGLFRSIRVPSIAMICGLLAFPIVILAVTGGTRGQARPAPSVPVQTAHETYQFCFWNVENLFDDRPDKRENEADREFDSWFSRDAVARELKFNHIASALVQLNAGRGPDIIALAEVESVRAAELLLEALNRKLKNPNWHYKHVLMKDLNAGRHIAPGLITRLPVKASETRLHGRMMRVLEAHVVVDGHDLAILATHWTSRVSDTRGDKRGNYGDLTYGVFKGMYRRNPNVDCLICGDFNDDPDSPSVIEHLHVTGNRAEAVSRGSDPKLFGLMIGKDPQNGFGTHYYGGKFSTFDQIVVSPGMLDDKGWDCLPDTLNVPSNAIIRSGDRQKRPWRFGGPNDRQPRGYSDHFPVRVNLQVRK